MITGTSDYTLTNMREYKQSLCLARRSADPDLSDEVVFISSHSPPIHQPFEVSNYLCLYNVHEKLLNDMVSRWNDNLITDFFL